MSKLKEQKKEVQYINKDFVDFRQALINYTKQYFPNTYSDFNEASPGMHFIEMASSVGDVLSFYGDVQLQESFLYTVQEKINLYNLAQGMGYKPKTITPAQVDLDVMQLVPSIGSGDDTRPDFNYALTIDSGMVVSTEDDIQFRTTEDVNFRFSSSFSPTNVNVYAVASDGSIEWYILKKTIKAVSGRVVSQSFEFEDAKPYDKITLLEENIGEVISVTDSDEETWYEVPFMAQDLVPIQVKNIPYNDPKLSAHNSSVPYLLTYQKIEKRFVTRLRKDNRTEIQFGGGISAEQDEEIVPSPYNVALGLDYFQRVEDVSIDPTNFLYTKTYGKAPSNQTLTVKYSLTEGLEENVRSNTITNVDVISTDELYGDISDATATEVLDSVTVNNPEPAYGGKDSENLEVMREEAMAHFAAQNRAVTKEDYILRCYTMPPKFGAIAKAYIEQDIQNSQWNTYESLERIANPYALNLYILSYDANKNFVPANEALKHNLREYLSQYRLMTDAINIRDAFIVNIGIKFDIITRPDTDSFEVLARCNRRLRELFDPDKLEIGQPILVNKLKTELDRVEGVQTVMDMEFENKTDTTLGYSSNEYDMDVANRNGIIYPSVDPCIFEVKYPKRDISGRVVDH